MKEGRKFRRREEERRELRRKRGSIRSRKGSTNRAPDGIWGLVRANAVA